MDCLKKDIIENKQSNNIKDLTNVTINKNIGVVNDNVIYKMKKENINHNKISIEVENSLHPIRNTKKSNVKKKKDTLIEMSEENEDGEVYGPIEGEYKLGKGEQILQEFIMC